MGIICNIRSTPRIRPNWQKSKGLIMWKLIKRTLTTLAVTTTMTSALLASSAASAVTVVEYHNAALDAYFITGRTTEQALLDAAPSFRRTGMTFQATSGTDSSGTYTRICRFYVSLTAPYTSSADGCDDPNRDERAG